MAPKPAPTDRITRSRKVQGTVPSSLGHNIHDQAVVATAPTSSDQDVLNVDAKTNPTFSDQNVLDQGVDANALTSLDQDAKEELVVLQPSLEWESVSASAEKELFVSAKRKGVEMIDTGKRAKSELNHDKKETNTLEAESLKKPELEVASANITEKEVAKSKRKALDEAYDLAILRSEAKGVVDGHQKVIRKLEEELLQLSEAKANKEVVAAKRTALKSENKLWNEAESVVSNLQKEIDKLELIILAPV
jgi:hypothetical protein